MYFDFNFYSSLLLPAFFQGILFFLLLSYRGIREGRLSDKLLAFLLLFYALRLAYWMLGFASWYDSRDAYSTFMFYFPFNHWLAIGPLVYFYFRSLTNREFRFLSRHRWHFLPATLWLLRALAFFMADVVVSHWWRGEPFPYHYGTKGAWAEKGLGVWDMVFDYATFFSIFLYSLLTLRIYRRYRHYVDDHFSDTVPLRFSWLRNLLYAVLLIQMIWIAFSAADFFLEKPLTYSQDWYGFFLLGVLVYYVSTSGYYQPPHTAQQLHFEPGGAAVGNEPLPPVENAEISAWREKLLLFMAAERLYLDPELTLNELAIQLNISPSFLSKLINAGLGKNFNDFINEMRVEAVKNNLLDPSKQHYSLLALAFESGFNSKATFNRAFRKHTGQSPSEFIRAQKK